MSFHGLILEYAGNLCQWDVRPESNTQEKVR